MKTAMECWVSNGMNLDNYSQAVKEAMEEYASQSVEKQSLMKEYITQSVPPTPDGDELSNKEVKEMCDSFSTPITEDIKNNKTINHIRNIKLIQAMYSGKKFYVECYPTDKGALCFPNSNRAVKEIELPDFDLYEEKLGYKWVKQNQAPVTDKPFTEQNVHDFLQSDISAKTLCSIINEKAIEWAVAKYTHDNVPEIDLNTK